MAFVVRESFSGASLVLGPCIGGMGEVYLQTFGSRRIRCILLQAALEDSIWKQTIHRESCATIKSQDLCKIHYIGICVAVTRYFSRTAMHQCTPGCAMLLHFRLGSLHRGHEVISLGNPGASGTFGAAMTPAPLGHLTCTACTRAASASASASEWNGLDWTGLVGVKGV